MLLAPASERRLAVPLPAPPIPQCRVLTEYSGQRVGKSCCAKHWGRFSSCPFPFLPLFAPCDASLHCQYSATQCWGIVLAGQLDTR